MSRRWCCATAAAGPGASGLVAADEARSLCSLGDLACGPGGDAAFCQHVQGTVGVGVTDNCGHAYAHVEDTLHLIGADAATGGQQGEDGSRAPGCAVEYRAGAAGQDTCQVGGDSAAGDVSEGVDVALGGQSQAVTSVDAGRRQQFSSQRP